jgi:hypothetical protein
MSRPAARETAIAGSNPINADVVLEANPDVVGHINGGTTSMSPAEIERKITIGRSRNTPPAARAAEVVQGQGPGTSGH